MLCCRIISVRCVRPRGVVLLLIRLHEDRVEGTNYLILIYHQITRGMYGAGIEEREREDGTISIFHIVRCYAYDIPPMIESFRICSLYFADLPASDSWARLFQIYTIMRI